MIKRILMLVSLSFCFFAVSAQPTTVIRSAPLSTENQRFINTLLPMITAANDKVIKERSQLKILHAKFEAKKPLSVREQQWLTHLAQRYHVNSDFTQTDNWTILLRRVDVLPPSLVLAQAITESGWGRSRFAKEGNNYFGQWCFSEGCGLVPLARPAGQTYELRVFENMNTALTSYYYNLNVNEAYIPLRLIRSHAREQNNTLSGVQLAKGLTQYSTRKDAYIRDIQTVITRFHLNQYDNGVQAV
jgi:Bax protein